MKATVNVEFTDEELRNYLEDAGRRLVVNFIREGLAGLNAPGVLDAIRRGIGIGTDTALNGAQDAPPPASRSGSFKDVGVPPCARVAESPFNDEEWGCHVCGLINGLHRPACRRCGHERCDVVVPPAPHTPPTSSSSPEKPAA